MSLIPSVVAGGGVLPADYYFALSSDPGLTQTLDLSGNILSISGGNSVDVAAATTVSTSAVKLTAQSYNTGFAQTEFSGNVVGFGEIKSLNLLGSSAVLNGAQAQVLVSDSGIGVSPTIKFEKPLTTADITFDGTSINLSTIRLNSEVLDALGNPGAAGQVLQSSGAGLPVVWGSGVAGAITAVQGGSNISVDATNPIAPIVNFDPTNGINMQGYLVKNTGGVQNIGDGAAAMTIVVQDTLTPDYSQIQLTNAKVDIDAPSVSVTARSGDVNITVGGNVNITNGATLNATFYNGGMDMNKGSIDNASYISINGNMDTTGASRIIMNEQSTLNSVYFDNNGSNFSIVRGGAATLTEAAFVDFPRLTVQSPAPAIRLTTGGTFPADIEYNEGLQTLAVNNVAVFQTSTGAVEGVQMGFEGTNNYYRGLGLPLYIAQDSTNQASNYMVFDTGNGTGGIKIETNEFFDIVAANQARVESGSNVLLTAGVGSSVISRVKNSLPGLEVTDTATRIVGDSSSAYDSVLQFYDNNGGANFNLIGNTINYSLKMENNPVSTDYITKQLAGGVGGSSGVEIKSQSGFVKFLDSSTAQKASVNYAQLNNKITMECPAGGQVAVVAGTGGLTLNTTGDLILDGANIDSLTAGANTTHHLRIKLNGVYYKIQLKAD